MADLQLAVEHRQDRPPRWAYLHPFQHGFRLGTVAQRGEVRTQTPERVRLSHRCESGQLTFKAADGATAVAPVELLGAAAATALPARIVGAGCTQLAALVASDRPPSLATAMADDLRPQRSAKAARAQRAAVGASLDAPIASAVRARLDHGRQACVAQRSLGSCVMACATPAAAGAYGDRRAPGGDVAAPADIGCAIAATDRERPVLAAAAAATNVGADLSGLAGRARDGSARAWERGRWGPSRRRRDGPTGQSRRRRSP